MTSGELIWTGSTSCRLGSTEFSTLGGRDEAEHRLHEIGPRSSTAEHFVLLKVSETLDRLVALVTGLAPLRIVELGIFRGGSTALLAALSRPEKLVALDLSPRREPALDLFLEREGLADACRPCYGIDQADVASVRAVVDEEFGGDPLDLVVDDASHLGPQTRASFDELFPRLRPGGLFVIEDWSWALQGFDLGEPMDPLIHDLVRVAGRAPDVIASVHLRWDLAVVERGPAGLEPGSFTVGSWTEPATAPFAPGGPGPASPPTG